MEQAGLGCLQKEVAKRTGFTKLSVHKVGARLVERDILTVKRQGKTNENSLAPWLGKDRRP